jgi:hypothetical protein
MAINVSFNGATIYKPGAYSEEIIDLGGGFPLSPAGIVAIFGESSSGTPGANEPDIKNVVYTPDQLPALTAKYGSGNIVDAASFLFSPATDGAIPSGAQAVYIYKTNSSTQASLALAGSYGTLQALQYGTIGNLITYMNVLLAETPATVTGTVVVTTGLGAGQILNIAQNGAAPLTHTISGALSPSALVSELNGAFPGLTFSLSLVAPIGALEITMSAAPTQYQLGWGRSFEVLAGSANSSLGLSVGEHDAVVEPSATITVNNTNTLIVESGTEGGNVVMTVGYAGVGATAASVTNNGTNLVLSQTGGPDAASISLPLAGFSTLNTLAAGIAALNTGWSASVTNTLYGQLLVGQLDQASAVGALSAAGHQPARLKNDAANVANFFSLSQSVQILNQAHVGLPQAAQTLIGGGIALAGGSLGGTHTASIVNALAAFQKIRVNSVVPLFSRDATADKADSLTDASSDYTLLGIQQAVKTHLSLTASTKNRSERQGYMSMKDTYVNCKARAGLLADFREQLMIQDILQVNSLGNIMWFQPWALACLIAGSRGGAPIGTPLTFKFMNCSGIRQTGQPMSTPEANIVEDFDPDTQYEDAIIAGITFLEAPQTGGFRVVVDNTTYGKDANWVYNRGNVLYAADTVAFNFRSQLEAIYVGVKNTVKANEVKNVCEAILATFLAQGITVSTPDAPNGFKQLQVQIVGNTINIQVTVKLVEGIDFVLAQITLQRASSAA